MVRIINILVLYLISGSVYSVDIEINKDLYSYEAATVDCVIKASTKHKVPANVLLAIASVEHGLNGQYVKNKNGSFDIGHFQINSYHWNKNGLFNHTGIETKDIAWRGCMNAELAAWMLKNHLNEQVDQDYWTKAANYHSKTKKYNKQYKRKLMAYSKKWAEWLTAKYPETHVSTR